MDSSLACNESELVIIQDEEFDSKIKSIDTS